MQPRSYNLVDGKKDLELVCSFKEFPIRMGVTHRDPITDEFADMNFCISKSTGMVQLDPIVPPSVLYSNYDHNPGTVGNTWVLHHQYFSNFIIKNREKFRPLSKEFVEIGGSSGILYRNVCKHAQGLTWKIVDPANKGNLIPQPSCTLMQYEELFDPIKHLSETTDCVVHSHFLEHHDSPARFFAECQENMKLGSLMFFSIPHMNQGFANGYLNTMMFEHNYFCSVEFINYLVRKHGFEVIDSYGFEKHSIFYAVQLTSKKPKDLDINSWFVGTYEKNLYMLYNYFARLFKLVETVKRLDQPVYLFGSHVTSQFLLKAGVPEDQVVAILDNDPTKKAKRLYGTPFMTHSAAYIKPDSKPIVVIPPNPYANEIKDGLKNINSSVIIAG